MVAGLNAAGLALGAEPCVFGRTNSYIGVMIDDLTLRGVTEPYRMFTSRAEFRLTLRADNADQRLTPIGVQVGCVRIERQQAFGKKAESLARAKAAPVSYTHLDVYKRQPFRSCRDTAGHSGFARSR